ncbi:MG2 domain-containing protein [Adhaeribacter aquaticus]|uniref:MG2 domain-containing protein n=1 Tax=Adhaeribacter aquaticus TaxID=299567 RepID=UPI0012F78CE8|nr:MG2 domain-containing protein [Adhaeribacter aquaticus]
MMFALQFIKQGFLLSLVWVLSLSSALAQTDSLKTIARQFTSYQQKHLQEKVFLHLDRPVYLSGETMWFKIYYVDGTFHKPLNVSKVAYVEVLDQNQSPVLQAKVELKKGIGQGSFVVPTSLFSGNYTVRAYTSWMKNFNSDYFFTSPVTFINTTKVLGTEIAKTDPTYNVQFFPEGGNLVSGLANKVAFKITDRNGKGLEAEGSILDDRSKPVASFSTLKFGMGNFTFTPAENQHYVAVFKLKNGQPLTQKLPQVYQTGYVLHLEESNFNQIKLSVQTKNINSSEPIYLLGHARQLVSVAIDKNLENGQAEILIDKDKLGDGITHFTLFNSQKKPVCERLYFKQPQKSLTISANANKPQFANREKVILTINTPVQTDSANLSLAVFQIDSLQKHQPATIFNYLWLSSDLKGTIESPEYYFTSNSSETSEALDNLMLTHGWSRFKWENILAGKAADFEFLPEINSHIIRGRVVQASTGAPAEKIATYLASPSRLVRLYNSTSQKDGLIQFEMKDFTGPREVILQSNIKRDSTYRFEIFSPFYSKFPDYKLPAFYLSEALKPELTQRHVQIQTQHAYFDKFRRIYSLPKVDSLSFYGNPDAKYNLDDYTRFKVLEEVMREYVPGVMVRIRKDGFHFLTYDKSNDLFFQNNPMVLLDGLPVFDINKIMAFDPLKIQKLEVITNRYNQGSLSYEGLISYTTYKGDLGGFQVDSRALLMEYEGLQLQREFYAPTYATTQQQQGRLPDFRNLLYWKPVLTTRANEVQKLEFYTSDQVGKYLVVVQGLSKAGIAGHTSFTFEVKKAL